MPPRAAEGRAGGRCRLPTAARVSGALPVFYPWIHNIPHTYLLAFITWTSKIHFKTIINCLRYESLDVHGYLTEIRIMNIFDIERFNVDNE